MSRESGKPFDSLESAHQFLRLLTDEVMEARKEIEADIAREANAPPAGTRRVDALRMASYNLKLAQQHLTRSTRIFNDLRTLRRLLFDERAAAKQETAKVVAEEPSKTPVVLPPPKLPPSPALKPSGFLRTQAAANLPHPTATEAIQAPKSRIARAGD